ncbi:MAG: adenylate/guanylate cyclase domain-containing response regulator, partial [Casimicrobiaceae bacterium]
LVVDDNKVNRLMLSRALQLLGHEVVTADNGRTALEKLRGERFDLLLLDLKMPEMDGFDLLELRAEEPSMHDVPVIVTSAVEGVADVARCIELGADDFLRKPVNSVLLRARVDSSLERKFLRDRQRATLARIGDGMADEPDVKVEGRSEEATLLVASLAGYVAEAETPSAGDTLELLSTWTTLMLDAIESHGGRVQHINGDGLMALFGATKAVATGHDPAVAAVLAAQEMHALTTQLDSDRNVATKSSAALGIGIATGRVVTGYAGTASRMARVCVGTATQRAAHLAGISAAGRVGVLLDAATHAALAGHIETTALSSARLGTHLRDIVAYTLAK